MGNIIEDDRERCKRIAYIIIIIIGSIVLYFSCVFATFAFVIARHPDNDRTTGCPIDLPDCPDQKKMQCYFDNMRFCYGMGVLTTISMLLIAFSIVVFVMGIQHLRGVKMSGRLYAYLFVTGCDDTIKPEDVIPLNR